jgi:hypothetical protein
MATHVFPAFLWLCRFTLGFHYKGIPYLEPGFATIVPLTSETQQQRQQDCAQKVTGPQRQAKQQGLVDGGVNKIIAEAQGAKRDQPAEAKDKPVISMGASAHSSPEQQSAASNKHGSKYAAEPSLSSSVFGHAFQLVTSLFAFVFAKYEPEVSVIQGECAANERGF